MTATASPTQVNGSAPPRRLPVMGDWRPIEFDSPAEKPKVEAAAPAEPAPSETMPPAPDPVAEAEAAAIRARTEAEVEARRRQAKAEAQATLIKAREEAEKQRLANRRAAMALEEKEAAHLTKLAAENAEREEIERKAAEARKAHEAEQAAEEQRAESVAEADEKWRQYAIRFAVVCGIVALPVQMAAFYNKDALWMLAAPLMLEGGAWVVHRGAAAAAANSRPTWHYRAIVWLLAFIAAGINLYHGLHAFDPGTAIGTAFASIAGPGVWDLHENGRIRKRDGKQTRRERKAAEKAAKRIAAEEAAEKAAADKAAAEAAKQLAEDRKKLFSKVWEHAVKLAADYGETGVTEAIWKQAKIDVEGAPPGESADVIRMRNAAEARVEAARQNKPVNTLNKAKSAQVNQQVPPRSRRGHVGGPKARGVRRPNDSQKYSSGARNQMSIAAKSGLRKEAK
ncbi:hypothetical protein [Streptomyces sp. SAJ15]|uniref:hypothetical protein n=1 Tax=Streptomyces sp. SAJ15 TaxID=2011095 RepID=UPI00118668A7|nr:hypothetical protein [Streptomyces sp. SAJ15]TVL89774.1 hypothetical protein CD790_25595 [Streptomyces sp. SAJ15]